MLARLSIKVQSQPIVDRLLQILPRSQISFGSLRHVANTAAGNKVASVRPARLTRAEAEELVAGVANRTSEVIAKDEHPLRIVRIIAVGGILTKHDRIQDIDLLVQLESKPGSTPNEKDRRALLQALKERSPTLKLQVWEPGFANLPGRVIWEAWRVGRPF